MIKHLLSRLAAAILPIHLIIPPSEILPLDPKILLPKRRILNLIAQILRNPRLIRTNLLQPALDILRHPIVHLRLLLERVVVPGTNGRCAFYACPARRIFVNTVVVVVVVVGGSAVVGHVADGAVRGGAPETADFEVCFGGVEDVVEVVGCGSGGGAWGLDAAVYARKECVSS
jgi:hypothetical protein